MPFGDRLKKFREDKGYTQEQLAELVGVAKTTITGYERGNRTPDVAKIKKLAKALGVTGDELLDTGIDTKKAPSISDESKQVAKRYEKLDSRGQGAILALLSYEESKAEAVEPVGEVEPEPQTRIIPLYRTPAAAGYLSPTEGQDYDDYEIAYDLPGDFAVRIDGDSMEPYIHDGEIVRCVRSNGLQIGDVGIFYVDGDTLCKQYCTDGKNLFLLSLNRERADADRTIWHFSNSTVQLYGKVLTRKKPPMP